MRDELLIKSLYIKKRKEGSLATLYPVIAKEWHPTKNGELSPDQVLFGSSTKVWWKCSKNHEWTTSVNSRTNFNSGCPYCAGRFAIKGKTDLQTISPNLAKEWHPTLNQDLTPSDVSAQSNKKAWWICSKCGYEWKATIGSRHQGNGCPKCGREKCSIAKYKPVRCIETGEIYKSIKDAEKAIKTKHISDCCNGKRKTTGGYHWEYIKE